MISGKKSKLRIFLSLIIALLFLASCGSSGDTDRVPADDNDDDDAPPPTITITINTPTPEPTPVFAPIDYDTVKPYEVGQILVLMYHWLTEDESYEYGRNIDDFRQDLQDLYDMGFRVISMSDYINNNITTPPGFTPVVFTFDDGFSSAFSLQNVNGELVPAENTAVYILEEFYKQNPDFGKTATFYVNGLDLRDPFAGEGTVEQRFNWLIDNGYDIGNHTWSHSNLRTEISTADQLQREIGMVDKLITDNVPGYKPMGIAYPFGERPSDELMPYLLEGEYEGHSYSYEFAFRVGEDPVNRPTAPNRVNFYPWSISRVRGSSDEGQADLGNKLTVEYVQNPDRRYISDGSAFRISVPSIYAHNIDEDSIKDKELYIYELPE